METRVFLTYNTQENGIYQGITINHKGLTPDEVQASVEIYAHMKETVGGYRRLP